MKKVTLVYFSPTGNTRRIAQISINAAIIQSKPEVKIKSILCLKLL